MGAYLASHVCLSRSLSLCLCLCLCLRVIAGGWGGWGGTSIHVQPFTMVVAGCCCRFIGPNGCGKSLLMECLGRRLFPVPANIDVYHVVSEIEATDMTSLEAVLDVDDERKRLEAEADELSARLAEADPEEAEELTEEMSDVYERLEEMDAATAEARAATILHGLGFTKAMQAKRTKEFSGGWRMRIALARALFLQPSMLILDEPTNHLDLEAVVWLEQYLAKFKRILFMVSHSQDFMNNVCTHIVRLHQKKLEYFGGNYDSYVRTRREKEEAQMKQYSWEQDQIKHMKDYIAKCVFVVYCCCVRLVREGVCTACVSSFLVQPRAGSATGLLSSPDRRKAKKKRSPR